MTMERGDFLIFTAVFAMMTAGMVIYAVDQGLPHGPLPLLAALFVFTLYESPIVDRYKETIRQ